MHIVICDDNAALLQVLETKVRRILQNTPYTLAMFTDPTAALLHTEETPADILITDIKMPDIDGISLSKRLSEAKTQIIFMSSFDSFAEAVFAVEPVYYLKKPIDSEKLQEALNRAIRRIQKRAHTIDVVDKGRAVRIPCEDIQYAESDRRKITLHTESESITLYGKLSELAEKLPDSFFFCHKSYLVNLGFVHAIACYTVTLRDKTELPISKARYRKMKETLLQFWGKETL